MAESEDKTTMKVPTWFRDWVKVHKRDDGTRRKVRTITRMYPTVDLTQFDHGRAGQLQARADRAASGDDAGTDGIDPMVAAVPERYDEPVLTENSGDFDALGVETETW